MNRQETIPVGVQYFLQDCMCGQPSRKLDPLKPHFCIVKLGFTGDALYLISAQNINFGYSLEPPHRGGSNEYPQIMF